MIKLPSFTKLPSAWINARGLMAFKWGPGGSDEIAALLVLTVIANHIAPETGIARLSYEQLAEMASISRVKVSAGLKILAARAIVDKTPDGRGSYRLADYDPTGGWAMFPAVGLYRHNVVEAFTEFRLRRRSELDAMKLYFLFAARRDRDTNLALIGYEKIEQYSGVPRNHIRAGLSLLTANNLIHVDRVQSEISDFGLASGYRLAHLETRRHMATTGRREDGLLKEINL